MYHDLDFWRTVAIGFAGIGQTLFVLLYATFPWWRTFLGRALFYKAVTLMILTDFILAARLFEFGNLDVWFVVIYGLLGIGIWAQALAFLSVKRNGKRDTGRALRDAEKAVRDAQKDLR